MLTCLKRVTEGAKNFVSYFDGHITIGLQQYVNNPMPNIDPSLF